MSFYYKAKLSCNKEIYCNEINVKQYKTLLKCFLGENLNSDIIFKNLNTIILQNTEYKDLKELNFFDYFLIVLYLRYISIGDLITAQFEQNDKKVKLEISVNKIINTLLNFNVNKILKTTVYKEISIYYRLPNIFEFQTINNDKFLNVSFFIEKIIIGNKTILIQDFNSTDIEKILDNLPIKLTTNIFKKIRNIINSFNNIDIFQFLKGFEKQIYFGFNLSNYCSLLRLLFGGDLNTLYENIFILSKYCNFSAQYIETCTPGEYFLFIKKLEERLSKNKKQTNEQFVSNEGFNDGLG
jgi:hypothetical protein